MCVCLPTTNHSQRNYWTASTLATLCTTENLPSLRSLQIISLLLPLWLSQLSLHYIENAGEMLRVHIFSITHRIFLFFVTFLYEIHENVLCHSSPYFPHYFSNNAPSARLTRAISCANEKTNLWNFHIESFWVGCCAREINVAPLNTLFMIFHKIIGVYGCKVNCNNGNSTRAPTTSYIILVFVKFIWPPTPHVFPPELLRVTPHCV